MTITHLFNKKEKDLPMEAFPFLNIDKSGIVWGKKCHRMRQILLLPQETIKTFNLQPWELRENIITKWIDLHSLQSWTVLKINKVKLRITFLCEPCSKVRHLAPISKLLNKRWILASVIESWTVTVGDTIINLWVQYEEIPYSLKERVLRYLTNNPYPIKSTELVNEIGLQTSYCRALPMISKDFPQQLKKLIIYIKNK